jgi:hypothetical protein
VSRIDLGLIAFDAILAGVGYALLCALGIARLQRGDVRLLGLSYLVGWALFGSVLSLGLMAGIQLRVATVVLVGAVLAGGCAIAVRRTARTRPALAPRPERGRPHPLALLAAGLGAAILVVELAAAVVASIKSGWTTDIDVLTAWLPRAGIIYSTHQLDPGTWGTFLCPWYPPLAPAMYAGTFAFAGGFHPSVLPLQQVILGIAFLLAVLGLLDRYAPRWLSLPSLALLVSAPWFWWRLHSLLPDQTLAYLLVGAGLTSVLWLQERCRAWLGLAVVFLVAASLTKIEGVVFGSVLVAVVLVAGFRQQRRAALPAVVLLVGPAAIVPWHLWLARHQVPTSTPDYNAPHLLSPTFLADRIGRLTYALDSMLGWGLSLDLRVPTLAMIWLSIGVALAVWRSIPVISSTVGAWLVLSFLSLGAIYWTGRVEVHWYVETSASRVGGMIIIAAAVLTPLLLGLALGKRQAPTPEPRADDELARPG